MWEKVVAMVIYINADVKPSFHIAECTSEGGGAIAHPKSLRCEKIWGKCSMTQLHQYFNVLSVHECVTDVTSTNEPRLHAPAYIKAWQNQI